MALPSQNQAGGDLGLRLDVIAAASLGKCRKQHRETIIKPSAESDFWDCVGQYSQDIFMKWGSREKNGFTYYFQKGTTKSQWERPAEVQRVVQEGLADARRGSDYSPQRPWETCELLSIAHILCLQNRTSACEATQQDMAQCLRSRKKPL